MEAEKISVKHGSQNRKENRHEIFGHPACRQFGVGGEKNKLKEGKEINSKEKHF